MGTSRSPAELAAKFNKFDKYLVGAQREGVRAGALLVTNAVRAELRTAVPSGRLSGVGVRGARVSVGFDAPKSDKNPQALVRMRGPAHLVESPTRPHAIKHRRKRALAGGGFGPVAGVKQHPGTRGKHPWAKGVAKAQPRVLGEMDKAVFASMVKAFR